MQRERLEKLREEGITRAVDHVLTVMVPCALASRGKHPLTLALAEDGTLLYANAPCVAPWRVAVYEAAERLGEKTCAWACGRVMAGARGRSTSGNLPDVLSSIAVLNAAVERANRAAKYNLTTSHRGPGSWPVLPHRGLSTMGLHVRNVHTARVLAAWLNRHAVLAPKVSPQALHHFIPYVVAAAVPLAGEHADEPQRLGGLILSANGIDGMTVLGRVDRAVRNGVFRYELALDQGRVKDYASTLFVDEYGHCLVCGHAYTDGKRHGRSTKHKTRVAAALRALQQTFRTQAQRAEAAAATRGQCG